MCFGFGFLTLSWLVVGGSKVNVALGPEETEGIVVSFLLIIPEMCAFTSIPWRKELLRELLLLHTADAKLVICRDAISGICLKPNYHITEELLVSY